MREGALGQLRLRAGARPPDHAARAQPASGQLEPATWDEALGLVARRFTELRDAHGGQSLAAFACSRSTNEDIYLFQKMAREALQTNNVDCCARV